LPNEVREQGAIPRNPQAGQVERARVQGRGDAGQSVIPPDIYKRSLLRAANTLMDNGFLRQEGGQQIYIQAARGLIAAGSAGFASATTYHQEALRNGNQLAAERFQGIIAVMNSLRILQGQP